MKLRRTVPVLALALTCALTGSLSGCSSTGQRVAATVNGTEITSSDVDLLARAQCTYANQVVGHQMGTSAVSYAALRSKSLSALMNAALIDQLAAREKARPDLSKLPMLLDYSQQLVDQQPASMRAAVSQRLRRFARSELELQALGRKELGRHAPSSGPTTGSVLEQAGRQRLKRFARSSDIEVNPVYAVDEHGDIVKPEGSISVPVSSYAKESAKASYDPQQATPSWVMALPASQRCG